MQTQRGFGIALLVGVIAGGVGYWVGSTSPVTVPEAHAISSPEEEESESAVREFTPAEAPRESLATEEESTEPVDTGEVEELEARIAQLEEQLRKQSEQSGFKDESPEALQQRLRELNPNDPLSNRKRREEELAVLHRILELYPDHESAPAYLEKLAGTYVAIDATQSLAVLDEFGARIQLRPGRLESLRANALNFAGRGEEGRAIYAELARDPRLDEAEQCDYAFWHAHSLQRAGLYPEARQAYEELLARIGDDVPPELRSIHGGVQAQLENLPTD